MEHRLPDVSIVIPTHDRPRQLSECLAALAGLDYPAAHLEIIVVRDGGAAPPTDALEATRQRLRLTLVEQAQAGPAAARNAGCVRAAGSIIAFTDDDCQPETGWLRALVGRLADVPDTAVGGRTRNGLESNRFAAARQLIVDVGYEYFNSDPADAHFFASNNLAVSAQHLRAIGGFNPTLRTHEDRDLCDRWIGRGWRLSYVPDAIVWHRHVLGFRSFCRLHYQHGRGAWRFHRVRQGRDGRPVERPRPDPRFYWRLVRRASSKGSPQMRVLSLVALAQFVTAAGVVRERCGAH